MDGQLETSANYSYMKDNPEVQLTFLDKHVKVKVIQNRSFVGFIHVIDPITHSVILSVPHEDSFHTILLPGHAILEITESPTTTNFNLKLPQRKLPTDSTKEEQFEKKKKIMAWLKLNLLPVTECESGIVVGSANILPPYNVTDICTDNPIVALQIKNIMNTMPQNFNPE